MKIIKLELLNLASLDNPEGEIINFEKGGLRDATIFSIVGPTGSGKSTIMDAICLALYNRAPRYPRKKGERNQGIEIYGEPEEGERNRLAPTDARNILTKGKKEGYSKLTFRANNSNIYRAEWRVNKKTKNYENAVTSLYKINIKENKETEEICDWESIPQIIGLDYDQFLRTVLIAQGSFSSFLKAKENERYELLEKLIGCEELYAGIAVKIKEQKDQALRQFTEIAANFSAQEKDLLQEDELEDLKQQIIKLENKEKEDKEELLKIIKALEWYELNEKYLDNIIKYEDDFKTKQQKIEDSKEKAYRLELHDSTLEAVAIYKEIKSIETDLSKHEEKLNSLAIKIAQKDDEIKRGEEEDLAKLKLIAEEASKNLEKQQPHIKKARKIKAELEGLKKVYEEKKEIKERAKKADFNAVKEFENNKKFIEEYESSLQKYQKSLADLDQELLEKEEFWKKAMEIAQNNYAEKKMKSDGQDATLLQNERNKVDKDLTDIKLAIRLQRDLKKKQNNKDEILNRQKQVTEENNIIGHQLKKFNIENLTKEIETLNKTYTLMTSKNLEQLRHELVEGEPCPLCGSNHHPFPKEGKMASLIVEIEKLLEHKAESLKKQQKEKESLTKKQAANNGILEGIREVLKNLETEMSIISNDCRDIYSVHNSWPESEEALLDLKQEIEKVFNDADKKLADYNNLIKDLDRLREEKEKIEQSKQEFEKISSDKRKALEKIINESNLLLQTEKGKTANLIAQKKEKSEAFKNAIESLNKIKSEIDAREDSFNMETGGKDPDKLETELMESKTRSDKAVADKFEFISFLREQLKEMNGEESAIKAEQNYEQKTITEKKNELQKWLSEYNQGKSEQIMEETIIFFFTTTDNWEELRIQLKDLNNEYTASKTLLNKELEAYKTHQEKKPEKSKDELQNGKSELENRSNTALIEAKARVQRHEKAKEEIGAMIEKKQAAELYKTEWEEIMKAIGSEGKSLRKIAQCHTLSFLIEHANFEIRKFNSRYELQQVKNSLGIRVIDHDRADDVRDTTSLSGGETFIVSLGLALGLSSLSSRNISFENLFIDEGFGTLDPDILDTVIDSLSMLQTSHGKKVGVISHTEAMNERIATQIRIIKHGNSGSSHIEIYP